MEGAAQEYRHDERAEAAEAVGEALSDAEVADADLVRCKARDLGKLGEMKWRYRVVDEGQSPRDEAIKVLEHAKELIDKHKATMLKAQAQREEKLAKAGIEVHETATNPPKGV